MRLPFVKKSTASCALFWQWPLAFSTIWLQYFLVSASCNPKFFDYGLQAVTKFLSLLDEEIAQIQCRLYFWLQISKLFNQTYGT